MTTDIAVTLLILLFTVILLVSEKLRVDLIALLVLGSLALSGLVTPGEALSGFSNPAVVTVWAVFILSGGLARTGVASVLGRQILRLAGDGEVRLLAVIMLSAGVMSAFMNNVGVAALLLPVVVNIARRTGRAPSRLLMPLAFGALLGGLTTLIGTPPNLLASDALRDFDLEPFSFFDFTPVGVVLLLVGVAFMAVLGRRMLPVRDVTQEFSRGQRPSFRTAFELQERLFAVRIPRNSPLAGKTLAESRFGSALGLNVIGVVRQGHTNLAPGPEMTLRVDDRLLVAGKPARLTQLNSQIPLMLIDEHLPAEALVSDQVGLAEVQVKPRARLIGQTLEGSGFRKHFAANVLAIRRAEQTFRTNLPGIPLEAGDTLLVQGNREQLNELESSPDLEWRSAGEASDFDLSHHLFTLQIPADSEFAGLSLRENRLADAYDINVLGILRGDESHLMPSPDMVLQAGDTLLVEGQPDSLAALRGFRELEVDTDQPPELSDLESEEYGLVEVVLSPQTTLVGQTLRQIHFREKFNLNVLAIWREGIAYRSNLRDMALRFGDALLLHGRRANLQLLASEPDFLAISEEIQEPLRSNRAALAGVIMLAVVVAVLTGWLPIAIAAIIGSALMILTGCLTMEEAYRLIEWRAVFLIAGMLPLGIAMQNSGTADYLASGMINLVGAAGPVAIMAGLFVMTTVASQFMPNPVVTVLMAPVAINSALELSLSPYTLIMVIAISASASFLSPVGHPANVLIMGPGGYRFSDYIKVGLPLSLIILVTTLLVLPLVWPLIP